MKCKIIMVAGVTEIELTAENEFEKTVVENFESTYSESTVSVRPSSDNYYGFPTKQKVHIYITSTRTK